jgi:hypothetical protein
MFDNTSEVGFGLFDMLVLEKANIGWGILVVVGAHCMV